MQSQPNINIQSQLEHLLKSLRHGYSEAGISRLVRKQAITRSVTTITQEAASEVEHFMREIVGEAISLCAGHSPNGGAALEAFSLMQAYALIASRDELSANHKESVHNKASVRNEESALNKGDSLPLNQSEFCIQVLATHHERLMTWIDTGRYGKGDSQSDLNLVAQHYLTDSGLRAAACSPFISCTELLLIAIQSTSQTRASTADIVDVMETT